MSKTYSFKAWAVCNTDSGRIMLIDVGDTTLRQKRLRMESPAIYMTRAAALHHKRDDEHLVRVVIKAED